MGHNIRRMVDAENEARAMGQGPRDISHAAKHLHEVAGAAMNVDHAIDVLHAMVFKAWRAGLSAHAIAKAANVNVERVAVIVEVRLDREANRKNR